MLETVTLDNINYNDILAEMLEKRLEYTDMWDDVSESDPGVTLLQMMCLLTDLQGYHADSVTRDHLLAYAKLAHVPPDGQKCTRIKFDCPDFGAVPRDTPIHIEGRGYEYSCRSGDYCCFTQKTTVVNCRQSLVTDGRRVIELPFFQAVNGEISLYRRDDVEDAWIAYPKYSIRRHSMGASVHVHGQETGLFRAVVKSGAGFSWTSDGTPGQEILVTSMPVLPQALRLWAGDGVRFRDVGCNVQGDKLLLGDGLDFPIPPKGHTVHPYRLILSDGPVEVSRKSKADCSNLPVQLGLPIMTRTGSFPQDAEQSLPRFRNMPGVLCTAEDYRAALCALSGLPADKICVSRRHDGIDLCLLADTESPPEVYQRRLEPFRQINTKVTVRKAQTVDIRLQGRIKLSRDNPIDRQKIKEALQSLIQSERAVLSNTALNRYLTSMAFVSRADVSAELPRVLLQQFGLPRISMEDVVYE